VLFPSLLLKIDCKRNTPLPPAILWTRKSDDPFLQGFYGVYEDLFSRLAQQEADSLQGEDTDGLPAKFGEE
jgi:hypothetical protein